MVGKTSPSPIRSPFLRTLRLRAGDTQAYPYNLPLLASGLTLEFTKPLTILVGENGTGKTTILNGIVDLCGFNRLGGSKSHLYGNDRPRVEGWAASWKPKVTNGFYLRPDSLHSFAGYVDELAAEAGRGAFTPYGGRSLSKQSHGESYLSLLENRFDGRGIYVFDEPEVALSPANQLVLISKLMQMAQSGEQQIIVATHAPMIMAIPGADLVEIKDGELHRVSFQNTRHYMLLKRFFDAPERMMASLTD